ncbi:MAG: Ppx/GppA family phosphatase [Myxococcales bacterium FL481]|nr:MAG: Ppx/GppA family phosphatase [Myxococcales bacterium FL481]
MLESHKPPLAASGETGWSAVIDIGSNSCLLLVARRRADGSLLVHSDTSTVTRLSEGAAQCGRLRPEAIARTLACLETYAATARALGCTCRAVATEAVRMVADADRFLEPAAKVLGAPVELLSGEQEARLSYLSVALEHPTDESLRVLDIGGGSTELVCGRGREIHSSESHPIGSVRLTEAHVTSDPPSPANLAAIEAHAQRVFAAQRIDPYPELCGLAGTITSAAALGLGLARYERHRVDGSRFSVDQMRALRDELATESSEQRASRPALGPGRADVIVAGMTILLCALQHCGAQTLLVRDRGLRYALL